MKNSHRQVFVLNCALRCNTARALTFGLALLLAILLAVPAAWSQGNQGTLEGSIVDQSGAAVPDAKLTATNDATAIKFSATSDANGLFTFPVLPVGTYTVEVEHSGFTKLTQKNVILTVGARLNLSLALSVAGQASAVTVTSETPILETTRSQVSSTVNDTAVENLPTNGRFHQFCVAYSRRHFGRSRRRHQLCRSTRHTQFPHR